MLESGPDGERTSARIQELDDALAETRLYVARIRVPEQSKRSGGRLLAMLHAADHLRRLLDRCRDEAKARAVLETEELQQPRLALESAVRDAHDWLRSPEGEPPEGELERIWNLLHEDREPFRERVLRSFATRELKTPGLPHRARRGALARAFGLSRVARDPSPAPCHHAGAAHADELPPHVEQAGPDE